jgi:hypothetical protein
MKRGTRSAAVVLSAATVPLVAALAPRWARVQQFEPACSTANPFFVTTCYARAGRRRGVVRYSGVARPHPDRYAPPDVHPHVSA